MSASLTRIHLVGELRAYFSAAKRGVFNVFLAYALILSGCTQTPRPPSPREIESNSPPALTLTTSDDRSTSPFDPSAKLHVFLFARTDCPISNRYAPEVRRIVEKFAAHDVKFHLVYPDPDTPSDAMAQHLREFAYPCSGLHDPRHELVRLAGAKVTPEAAVFDAQRQLIYCGRIDDRFAAFGTERASATTLDLINAIERGLEGGSVQCVRTEAIGCYIGDLR